jgi:hypothetical protein
MALARHYWLIASLLFTFQYVGYALYVFFRGFPSPLSLALGIARIPDLPHLFVLGLVAGSLSFGGAYTSWWRIHFNPLHPSRGGGPRWLATAAGLH